MTVTKRQILFGAVATGAAALGASFALRPKLSPAAEAFWSSQFQTPDGKQLPANAFRGRPLLLNFWAPWCPPCVEELPEMEQFYKEFQAQGWQVLGLALDSTAAVKAFLTKLPLTFAQGLGGLTGMELTRTLGNAQGGLPFSVAFGADGEPFWRQIGRTHLAQLREMAATRRQF